MNRVDCESSLDLETPLGDSPMRLTSHPEKSEHLEGKSTSTQLIKHESIRKQSIFFLQTRTYFLGNVSNPIIF